MDEIYIPIIISGVGGLFTLGAFCIVGAISIGTCLFVTKKHSESHSNDTGIHVDRSVITYHPNGQVQSEQKCIIDLRNISQSQLNEEFTSMETGRPNEVANTLAGGASAMAAGPFEIHKQAAQDVYTMGRDYAKSKLFTTTEQKKETSEPPVDAEIEIDASYMVEDPRDQNPRLAVKATKSFNQPYQTQPPSLLGAVAAVITHGGTMTTPRVEEGFRLVSGDSISGYSSRKSSAPNLEEPNIPMGTKSKNKEVKLWQRVKESVFPHWNRDPDLDRIASSRRPEGDNNSTGSQYKDENSNSSQHGGYKSQDRKTQKNKVIEPKPKSSQHSPNRNQESSIDQAKETKNETPPEETGQIKQVLIQDIQIGQTLEPEVFTDSNVIHLSGDQS